MLGLIVFASAAGCAVSAVTAITALTLGAVTTERKHAEQALHKAHDELELRQLIDTNGVRVSVNSLPKARGDVTAVGQVFSNLIGNAVKYLQPGRPGIIEIGGETENGAAHYWVRDNGAGIPVAAQRRLFQVFQRFTRNWLAAKV